MSRSKLIDDNSKQLLNFCREIEKDLSKLKQEEIPTELSVEKMLLAISRLYSVFLAGVQIKRNYLFASISGLSKEEKEKALGLILQIGKVNTELSSFKSKFVLEKKAQDKFSSLDNTSFELKSSLIDKTNFVNSVYLVLRKIKNAIETENLELYPIIFENQKKLKKELKAKIYKD